MTVTSTPTTEHADDDGYEHDHDDGYGHADDDGYEHAHDNSYEHADDGYEHAHDDGYEHADDGYWLHSRVVKGVGHLGHDEAMGAGGREFKPL